MVGPTMMPSASPTASAAKMIDLRCMDVFSLVFQIAVFLAAAEAWARIVVARYRLYQENVKKLFRRDKKALWISYHKDRDTMVLKTLCYSRLICGCSVRALRRRLIAT